MKHTFQKLAAAALTVSLLSTGASALSHTVIRGDTMWKLAAQYQTGTSEIIKANPQISNPGLSYRTAGENIAYGQHTPKAVVDGWMNSSGHRANILNAAYTQIGVGYVSQGHCWTQMFIG